MRKGFLFTEGWVEEMAFLSFKLVSQRHTEPLITASVLWKFPFPNTQWSYRKAGSTLMCIRVGCWEFNIQTIKSLNLKT